MLFGIGSKRIRIVPMIYLEKQVRHGSIDLRLGTDFLLTKRANTAIFDPLEDPSTIISRIANLQERIYVDLGEKLVLHPNQMVLGLYT